MNEKDWLMLKIIAEEKNITKAANRLFIAQPSMTYRLQQLEKEFATKIVSRNSTGVTLTPEGEYLLAYAQKMLLEFRAAKEKIQNMSGKVQGTLRLGSSAIFAYYELPRLLKTFLEMYPLVDISLKTGLSQKINRLLQTEEISIAIVRGDFAWDTEKYLIREEPICLVSPSPLTLEDLPKKPQITYGTDSALKKMIEEWWRQIFSVPPLINMEVDSMDTCRQMVLNGLGWAVFPEIGLPKQDDLFVQHLFWKDGTPLKRRTWLLYHADSLELSAVQAFIEYIKTTFATDEI
ncbi:MAG: LysR family transcriptional regulator [Sporomusaceae bacterium]|nr:LysR family transcriptional regulator [Sporomusaceae bacterium]